MKKIINYLVVCLFMGILVFNITIGNSSEANDISIRNTEALACYELEGNGHYLWTCCAPWEYTCLYEFSLPGLSYR